MLIADKRVLIITEAFPPQNYVAVNRMYRLTKHLPELGWKPYVLTVDTNYGLREDPSLLASLPDEVEIHRARYVEPTGRGIRMALDRKNRTYAGQLRSGGQIAPVAGDDGEPSRGLVTRSLRFARDRWVGNPDWYNTWYRPALRMAQQLIREHDIPLVMTTSPHLTGHRIGARLKQDGVNWVADFRDPAGYMTLLHSDLDAVSNHQREIERRATLESDAVTVTANGIGMILTDMYGLGNGSSEPSWHFIPTGTDTESNRPAAASTPRGYPYLIFPGWLSTTYGTEFFEVFAKALHDTAVRETGVRLLIVGDLRMNGPLLEPVISSLGIGDYVDLLDYQPQAEIARLIAGAKAGVLLTGRSARWWCLHAKAIEYMGMRKPVVAVVPEMSESRLHLEKTGLGVFLDGDRETAAGVLRDFLLDRLDMPPVNEEECARFTARRQAEAFSSVFNDVLAT